jgi:tRNA pseudouridine38-40 synthase
VACLDCGVAHYRLTLAYDGTDFSGWQRQATRRTVQGELERALSRLSGGVAVSVAGAGRTDAGVHALGQVASFGLPRAWDADELLRALNGLLPSDVRVLDSRAVDPGFHARRSAVAKLYRYELDIGGVRLPTRRRVAAHVPWELTPGPVEELAARYVGRHDFAAVASTGSDVKTTVRHVLRSEARFEAGTLTYDVEADGFLRKMVRSLVGGLIEAGRGRRSADELMAILGRGERRDWPAPAPPEGLTLVLVRYGPAGT